MTPPESARVIAMARLNERAKRIARMRKSVIAAGVATFVLAWGLALNDQLAHGTNTATATADSSSGSGLVPSILSSSDDDSEESDDGLVVAPPTSVQVAPTPAPVTTSQS